MATYAYNENNIIKGGVPYFPKTAYQYQQTSSSQELVQGFVAQQSSSYQAQLYAITATGTTKPLGVFDVQTQHVPLVSGVYDTRYGENTYIVDVIEWGVFLFKGTVASGNTVSKGQILEATTGGYLQLWTNGYPCAVCMEPGGISAGSNNTMGECLWIGHIGNVGERQAQEYVTISSATGATTISPLALVEMMESVYAATLATHALKTITINSPSSAEVKVNYTSGVLTTYAADGITQLYIRYRTRR